MGRSRPAAGVRIRARAADAISSAPNAKGDGSPPPLRPMARGSSPSITCLTQACLPQVI